MKFARALAVVSWVSVSLPLAIACGSAGSNGLFSASGGTTSSNKAGASGVTAGASAAGSETAGTSAGGTSESGAGESSVAGKGSAGATAHGGGSAGAGGKGEGGAPSGGSSGASAGSDGAGAGGATAGAGGSTGGTGGIVGNTGGGGGIVGSTGGASNGVGCPTVAPDFGAACQVTTPDSCFYSGIACSCQQIGGSTFVRKWGCYGTPEKCPADKPTTGVGPCKNGAECPYRGGDFCACVDNGNESKFMCQPDAPVCPAKPFKGLACTNVRTCAYADDQCFCNGDTWTCESNN